MQPVPDSRFTRYLIDYVGGGQYQLSAQGTLGQLLPMARSTDPQSLMKFAMTSPLRGDEVVVSPLAGLVQVTSTPVPALTELEARGIDPFQLVGAVLVAKQKPVRKARPKSDAPSRDATEPPTLLRQQQGEVESRDARKDARKDVRKDVRKDTRKGVRVYGLTLHAAPEELRQALERDRTSGGRLGWLFRDDGRTETDEDGSGRGRSESGN